MRLDPPDEFCKAAHAAFGHNDGGGLLCPDAGFADGWTPKL